MSTPPKAFIARSTSALTSSFLVTSAGMARTSALVFARMSSAAVFRSLSVRAHITTRAPSAASPMADALPIPLLAAVTSATLPFSPRSIAFSVVATARGRLDAWVACSRKRVAAFEKESGCAGVSRLFEEFRAVAGGDLHAAGLAVAQYLERQPFARLVA